MARYIDADKLMESVEDDFRGVCVYDVSPSEAVRDFERIVDEQPIVNVRKNVYGKWIDVVRGQQCSICGKIQYGYDNFRNFCAHCGADMR